MSYMLRRVDTDFWVIEGRQGGKGACAKDRGDTGKCLCTSTRASLDLGVNGAGIITKLSYPVS